MKKSIILIITIITILGCYKELILVDEWWVFRNSDLTVIMNNENYSYMNYIVPNFKDSCFVYVDGYITEESNIDYFLRMYVEIYNKDYGHKFQLYPENIVVNFEDKKMQYIRTVSLKKRKNSIYVDLEFYLDSIDGIKPGSVHLENKPGYLIEFDISKYIFEDSTYVSIDRFKGFQEEKVGVNKHPEYSPYD